MGQVILLIEDNETMVFCIKKYLETKNYTVQAETTLDSAYKYLETDKPDLMIVDWNLPDGTGDQLCRKIRSKWSNLPIIFLTVRGDAADMVRGFDLGADDYVVKPFHLDVLYSRIRAVLRRSGKEDNNLLLCGPLSFDKNRMQVFCGNEEIRLSGLEYQLLLLLMENKNHILPRGRLLELLWDAEGNFVNDNTLTVTIKRLREKLHNPSCIKTIRSFGYRMEEDE